MRGVEREPRWSQRSGWDREDDQDDPAEPARRAPGKRPRTLALAQERAMVLASRARGPAAGGSGGEQALAERGLSGRPAAFPHAELLERVFARPLSARAFFGDEAAAAARGLGARAYAVDDRVAFAGPRPDLHTAAHEAAHVLQCSAGVSRAGRAAAGHDLERHADLAADLVVAGRSAAHLFGGSPAAPAVRRKPANTSATDAVAPTGPVVTKLFSLTPRGTGGLLELSGRITIRSGHPTGAWNEQSKIDPKAIKAQVVTTLASRGRQLGSLPHMKVSLRAETRLNNLDPAARIALKFSWDATDWLISQGHLPANAPIHVLAEGQARLELSAGGLMKHGARTAARLEKKSKKLRELQEERDALTEPAGAEDRWAASRAEEMAGLDQDIERQAASVRTAWAESEGALARLGRSLSEAKGRMAEAVGDAAERQLMRFLERRTARLLTRAVGELLGHAIPIIGWALTIWDVVHLIRLALHHHHGTGPGGDSSGPSRGASARGAGHPTGAQHGDAPPGGPSSPIPLGAPAAPVDGPGSDVPPAHAGPHEPGHAHDPHAGQPGHHRRRRKSKRSGRPIKKTRSQSRGRHHSTPARGAPDGRRRHHHHHHHHHHHASHRRRASEARRRHAHPRRHRAKHRHRRDTIHRVLPPTWVTRWHDDHLVLDQHTVDRIAGVLPMRAPDGAVGRVASIHLEGGRQRHNDLVPFTLRIDLELPGGGKKTLVQHDAFEPPDSAHARGQYFVSHPDSLGRRLKSLLTAEPGQKVQATPHARVKIPGATLSVQEVRELPRGRLLLSNGKIIHRLTVMLVPHRVHGTPEVIDDNDTVHRIHAGKPVHFALEWIETTGH